MEEIQLIASGEELDPATATTMEEDLKARPTDVSKRLSLIGYYRSRKAIATDESSYYQHLKSLIEFCPGEKALQWLAPINKCGKYKELRKLWLHQVRAHPEDFMTQHNAARFLASFDPRTSEILWRRAQHKDPLNEAWARELSLLYWGLARGGHSARQSKFAKMAFEQNRNAMKLHEAMPVDSYLDTYREKFLKDMGELALFHEMVEEAKSYGNQLLMLTPAEEALPAESGISETITKYEYARHLGWSIIGRAYILEDNIPGARECLSNMANCAIPESPDMSLANELLRKNESTVVKGYLLRYRENLRILVNELEKPDADIGVLRKAALAKFPAGSPTGQSLLQSWRSSVQAKITKIDTALEKLADGSNVDL